ncbi:acyl-CoA dehydrogenase family protein [Salinispora tropica]|uniref:acyl-CoA dehydrogenase family protein n=1 Tax=Salinispora tropica TaxID=168695 RepID=UPI001EE3E4B4|nr:acyl-CoA dehydrogenase family protein [Salinispora tropica]
MPTAPEMALAAPGSATSGTNVAARTGVALRALATPGDARAVWRTLGEHGLLRDAGPAELPGLLGALDARCPVGVVLSVCVQVASALPVLREQVDGQPEDGPARTAYLEAITGHAMLALAATDRDGAGSDLMELGTTVRLNDRSLVLDGGKRWITNARTAAYALVLARHRPQRHFTSFVWVLVPTDAPGVRVSATRDTPLSNAGLGDLHFSQVHLDRSYLVGRPGRGMVSFARHIATERFAGGVWAAAMCRRVLADTHRRLTERPLGAGRAWDNPAIRERFARCVVEAWRIETACDAYRDSPDPLMTSMLLKASVAQGVDVVLGECAALLGAEAYVEDGLAQLRATAGMFATAGGATGAMLAGIAEHVPDLLRGQPW